MNFDNLTPIAVAAGQARSYFLLFQNEWRASLELLILLEFFAKSVNSDNPLLSGGHESPTVPVILDPVNRSEMPFDLAKLLLVHQVLKMDLVATKFGPSCLSRDDAAAHQHVESLICWMVNRGRERHRVHREIRLKEPESFQRAWVKNIDTILRGRT